MNKYSFIEAIKISVRDGSISGVVENLLDLPGRNPGHEWSNLSRWYNSLNSESKDWIKQIIKMSVDEALFGMMCVLDGVRSIEDDGQKGNLKLEFQKGEKVVLLNDPNDENLHDLYNEK